MLVRMMVKGECWKRAWHPIHCIQFVKAWFGALTVALLSSSSSSLGPLPTYEIWYYGPRLDRRFRIQFRHLGTWDLKGQVNSQVLNTVNTSVSQVSRPLNRHRETKSPASTSQFLESCGLHLIFFAQSEIVEVKVGPRCPPQIWTFNEKLLLQGKGHKKGQFLIFDELNSISASY